jgi:hypothetical protein
VVTILFSGYNYALAGGIDKEETLPDGTKLIYVSTERIYEVLEHYSVERQKLLDARWSTNQSLADKLVAVAAGAAGWWLFSKLGDSHATAELCGKAVSVIAGLIAFFYPNYVDYILGREYCGWDDRKNYQCWLTNYGSQWGPDPFQNEGYGVGTIYTDLNGFLNKQEGDHFKRAEFESGAVIVLRPRSKWNPPVNSNSFLSGIYSQKEMESDNGKPGFLFALLKDIERGV